VKLIIRGATVAVVAATAALIAAGCGSSGSSAGDAAKSAKALDLVPKNAIGYVTVNTDFNGDDWKQFSKMATAFDKDFKDVGSQVSTSFEDDDNKIDFKKDVEPWLGDNAGGALLDLGADGSGDNARGFIWVEIKDKAKFAKFAKDQGAKKDGSAGDFDIYQDGMDSKDYYGVNDELVVFAKDKKELASIVKFDGDSISDADGVSDVVDEVEGGSLGALVVSGDGVRALAKDNAQLKSVANSKQLKDFNGLSVGFSTDDNGYHVHGFVAGIGEVKNHTNKLFQQLPDTTIVALGGNNLGGALKSTADELGKDNQQVQQGVGALGAALGVDLNDIADAFGGEFALAIGGDDAVIGQIAGSAVGAAMGGGLSGVDPSNLGTAGNVTLAFEAGDSTAVTMDKLVGAVASLAAPGATPKAGTAGDFETKTIDAGGLPVTAASSKDVAALSVGADVFNGWGSGTLGESSAFKDAWGAADAPDDVAFSMFVDFGRIRTLADIKSGNDYTPAGWVGWAKGDGDKATFDVFMHIKKS